MAVEERRYSAGRLKAGAADVLGQNPALIPCLLATITFLALGATEAGLYPDVWYGAAVFLVALVVVTAVVLPLPRPGRATLAAAGLLAAFTAWAFVSITWAAEPGTAWDGASRTLLYLAAFCLFALWPMDARGATLLIGVFGLGVGVIGLVELLRVDAAAQPGSFFIDARFAEPTGYMNSNAALWTLGALACLHLAARRDLNPAVRGLALGSSGLLGALALMAQSRGWLIALPLALLVHLALMPGRLRTLAATIGAVAGVLAVRAPVVALHDEFDLARFDGMVAEATRAVLIMALVLLAAGTAGAVADRRLSAANPGPSRPGPIAGLAGVVVALIAVLGVALLASDRISQEWDDFKSGDEQAGIGASRFTTAAGSNRYDFWVVSWEAFEDHPVGGLGMDNFQAEYLRRGTSEEQPRFAHSLEMGVLAQTGLVGILLFAGWLAGALLAGGGALRAPPRRAAAAGALTVFAYWLLHASIDWFWELPGLTGPAVATLGIAAALAPRRELRAVTPPRALRAAIAGAGLIAVLAMAASWLAELEIDRASETWRSDPGAAFDRLERAESLNPLGVRAQLTAGTIAARLDRSGEAESWFEAALEREPDNAYALLELGVIAGEAGRLERAEALLARAAEANPRDPVTRRARRAVRRGSPLTLAAVNEAILRRSSRLGRHNQ
jgi:tetratricopeptide (TPR) repeat protein